MRIGIDLGGTKIEAIIMAADGSIVLRRRILSPSNSYASILSAIVGLVADLELEAGLQCSVGIGTPGAASLSGGLMKNCNSTQLNGQPLKQDLELRLGREIRIANDANCFALSEAIDGAAAHGNVVFGVILGTGVGGGLVVDRKLLVGRNAIAGEWGHVTMPDLHENRPCYCGKFDCVETYLCGAGLLQSARRGLPELKDCTELNQLALAGSSIAQNILVKYCEQLAAALTTLVNIVDPDVIVLGGGLSNIAALYTQLPNLMPRSVFGSEFQTDIVPARFGDSSGVRGAARLWPSEVLANEQSC